MSTKKSTFVNEVNRKMIYVLQAIFMNYYSLKYKKHQFVFSQNIRDTGKGEIVSNGQFNRS